MKKIILLSPLVILLVVLTNSCVPEKEPMCSRRGYGTVNELAVFPDSVALGSPIVGQFKITGFSSCSRFDGFYDDYYTMDVRPNFVHIPSPRIVDIGCQCEEIAPIFEESYSFYPSDTGALYINYAIYRDVLQYDTVYVY